MQVDAQGQTGIATGTPVRYADTSHRFMLCQVHSPDCGETGRVGQRATCLQETGGETRFETVQACCAGFSP